MRHRALALVTVALLALAGLATGTASASAPTAPLTTVANSDGTTSLQWDLQGSSDSINILPHLRCGPDPTATGTFAGSRIPCIWIVDHKAPLVAAPPGCPSTGQDYASWRCDMRLYRDITVNAAETGESSLIQFNTKPAGGSGICAWIPLALHLGKGKGTIQAADGCPERIVCEAGYAGKVNADKLDTVVGCKNRSTADISGPVLGDGAGDGASGSDDGTATDPTTGKSSGLDLAKCTGAGSGKKGNSPLYSVLVKPKGTRGMTVYVSMRRAVPVTVEVRMRTSGGSRIVRWTPRCAFKGTNVFRFPNATGGARSKRRYRVVVRSTNSTYPLISSYEALPRR
ncbi:hypothetical protein [Patulibacter sp.]|uniref:hypothetical protein n=1 Tax=Patulibacter sp. TaxID=1912859 RepID=UPI00271B151F|nr:hypothetical protein [Patulibacter sp.]MDO9407879.1 hypothetical protein [Patulibacter sp.]